MQSKLFWFLLTMIYEFGVFSVLRDVAKKHKAKSTPYKGALLNTARDATLCSVTNSKGPDPALLCEWQACQGAESQNPQTTHIHSFICKIF